MIYLASNSPRRAELLQQIGVDFKVHAVDIDESRWDSESSEEYVRRVALAKARVAAEQIAASDSSYAVIGADTTIVLGDDTIGKPRDRAQCRLILEQLSARRHHVLTAVALVTADASALRLSRNRVRFRALSSQEIESYCATDEPMDKAGAYAIQGTAAQYIEHLEGSYSAVMGLPLFETAELLRNAEMSS